GVVLRAPEDRHLEDLIAQRLEPAARYGQHEQEELPRPEHAAAFIGSLAGRALLRIFIALEVGSFLFLFDVDLHALNAGRKRLAVELDLGASDVDGESGRPD